MKSAAEACDRHRSGTSCARDWRGARRRRIVEKIRMKLAAEGSEPPLQIGHVDVQFSRQTEEGEIIAVAAERQNLRALRAEVGVNRRASTASLAGLKSWS